MGPYHYQNCFIVRSSSCGVGNKHPRKYATAQDRGVAVILLAAVIPASEEDSFTSGRDLGNFRGLNCLLIAYHFNCPPAIPLLDLFLVFTS